MSLCPETFGLAGRTIGNIQLHEFLYRTIGEKAKIFSEMACFSA